MAKTIALPIPVAVLVCVALALSYQGFYLLVEFALGNLLGFQDSAFIVSAILLLLCFALYKAVMRWLCPDEQNIGSQPVKGFGIAAVAILAGVVLFAIGQLAAFLFGLFGIQTEEALVQQVEAFDALSLWLPPRLLAIVVYGIFAPTAEELLFRGVICTILRQSLDERSALIISALLFGVSHFGAARFFIAFLAGLVLGYLRFRYKSTSCPAIAHSVSNILTVVTVM